MAPALPEGEPAPADGSLPPSVATGAGDRAFGVYLHVPFCTVRCGYCDFNTYTSLELGSGPGTIGPASYPDSLRREIALARGVLDRAGVARPASTVFVGGGTPTLLSGEALGGLVRDLERTFGFVPGAEVTVEANPDSVTPEQLQELAAAGVTRMSFGMQSAVPHVLAVLERTHRPERVPQAVAWARAAGLDVSLDLIYGTPGESLEDWRASLEAALAAEPDHVSAYALIVEDGTKLAGQVRRGQVPRPDDDDLADKYELADSVLTEAGLTWYEVSNWARGPEHACRHNVGYWHGDDWWGLGPGAHSHVGGVRWWNAKHPARWAAALAEGRSPAAGREQLDAGQQAVERVLLGVRLADGLPIADLEPEGRTAVAGLIGDGLLEGRPALAGRAVLTLRGRLLADAVVRALVP